MAAVCLLQHEARSLLMRLDNVKSFSLHMPMVAAAAVPASTFGAIEGFVRKERHEVQQVIRKYLLKNGKEVPAIAQRHFTAVRMHFNDFLSQVDIFADVLTQRGEHETGVMLAGLDAVARDALCLPGKFMMPPPLMCYLEKGYGAAIRRVQTKLPGGDKNPVTIIRIPRERMVASNIASSLVHEIGHQGAAFLSLVESLKRSLDRKKKEDLAWQYYHLWISEVLADLWSIAKVGIGSTIGLMAVISLPRHYVFRLSDDDPHPSPWLRVQLSCAIGNALYPDPQWRKTAEMWEALYPVGKLDKEKRRVFERIMAKMPEFISLLLGHRPVSLGRKNLRQVFFDARRTPATLRHLYERGGADPQIFQKITPTLAFAAIGQARADRRITPIKESNMLKELLEWWAVQQGTARLVGLIPGQSK